MAHVNLTVAQTYLDIGIHNGAPNNYPSADGVSSANTAWLSGTAAAGTYPGALTGFQAANTSSNKTPAQTRLISLAVTCTDEDAATTFDVNAYDSSLNYVLALVSIVNNTDTDESILAAATTIAHEAGTITFDVASDNDVVLLTFIAA